MMNPTNSMVSSEYLRKTAEILKPLKDYLHVLALKFGHACILDIGCGPGIDTIRMAKESNPEIKIYGIDRDPNMIQEANTLAFAHNLMHKTVHKTAVASHIPFESNFFDVVRSERMLQHLITPLQQMEVIRESLRVLKKGGLAIFADTDWASASIDFPDTELERKMVHFFVSRQIPNGYAGRQIYRLFKEHNLNDIQIKLFPIYFQNLAYTPFGDFLTRSAKKVNYFPKNQLNEWLQKLKKLDDSGRFFCHLNMVVVSGRL